MISQSACAILLMLMCFSFTFSQDKVTTELTTKNDWGQGSILTADGRELKGSIKYNEKLGVVDFEDGDDAKSFNPRAVTAFEFFDEVLQKQRIFYSLEYTDPEKGSRAPFFFEVLKDFQSFLILSKVDPVKIKERSTTPSGPGMPTHYNTMTEITQVETIYFLDEDEKILPYIQVKRKVVDSDLRDSEKNKKSFVDKDLLANYFTDEEILQMKEYAEKNDLDFRAKDDFLKILDFCEELRK
jgi:hypothetical protein